MAEKLLDRIRRMIRVKHYSVRAEKAYLHWAGRWVPGLRQSGVRGKMIRTRVAEHGAPGARNPLDGVL
jgi:hypothetical protein